MNKKGIEFLGGHVVNLVITVIVIVLLVFIGLKIYGLFVNEGTDLEQAQSQLLKVKEVADNTFENKEPGRIETFFSPAKNWFLRSFSESSADNLQDFPQSCIGKIGCLCICDNLNCDGASSCIGVNYDLRFRGIKYNIKNTGGANFLTEEIEETTYTEEIVEFMRLSKSVYQIRTSATERGVLLTPLFR